MFLKEPKANATFAEICGKTCGPFLVEDFDASFDFLYDDGFGLLEQSVQFLGPSEWSVRLE